VKIIVLIAGISLFLSVNSVLAYRPFSTEDAGVAGKGIVQTEISYDFFKWKNGDNDQIFLLVSPIYGPTERIELSVETPFVIHKSKGAMSEGVGDINLVGKYVLSWNNYDTNDALLTLKSVVKLNSGDVDKGLGRGDVEYSLVPVVSRTFGDFLTVHSQFGYTFVTQRKNPDLRHFYLYGLALDFTLAQPFHFVTEFAGNENPDRTFGQQNLALAGFTYEVNKHIILDTTVKKGIGSASPEWGWGIGAAIEF
jgi:Putative MetA-pathway of phenol degradation